MSSRSKFAILFKVIEIEMCYSLFYFWRCIDLMVKYNTRACIWKRQTEQSIDNAELHVIKLVIVLFGRGRHCLAYRRFWLAFCHIMFVCMKLRHWCSVVHILVHGATSLVFCCICPFVWSYVTCVLSYLAEYMMRLCDYSVQQLR